MSNSNIPTKVFIQNDYLLRQNSNGWIEKEQDVNQHTTPFRFVPKGLYDPLVFNINNRCICSMQTRYIDRPVQCPRCKVTVVSDEEYMNNYALYRMNIPYVNFIKVDALINQLKLVIQTPFPIRSLQDLWSLYLLDSDQPFSVVDYEAQLFYDRDGKEHYIAFTDLPGDNPEDIPTKDALGNKITIENMGLFGIKKLSYLYTSDATQLNKIGDLINEYLVITSPGRRPLHIFKDNSGKPVITVPEETISYRCIMFMNKQVGTYLGLKTISITDKATYCWYLNVMVNSHFTSNELLQPSKQSLGRTILDTRVTNSFRALIVADVELPMDTVGLPETYVYKCLQKNIIEEISQELVTQRKLKGGKKLVNQELADLDAKKHYLNKTDLAMKIFYEMVESYQDENGEWIVPAMCTLVRNPSLHKFNLMAYKIKLVKDTAIHLAISVDESYNADHDGDTVAVWLYTKPEHIADLLKITPDKLWTYDKEHRCPFVPKDEELYGLYMATVKKFATGRTRSFANLKEAEKAFNNQELEVNVECNIGNKLTTYGRAKLSKLINIDIEQFLKYNEQIEDEDLPPEMAKLKKVKGESEEHYKERVAKANKEYKKQKAEFDSFQNYKKDRKYREMNAIGMKNIGKLLLAMGSHPNKVQEYLDMQKFAMQIATIVGLGPVPYNDLFTGISQEQIDAIIKAPFESTDPNERNAEAMERKNKLRKLFAEELEKNIVNLPDSNIRELQQSMSKVSLKKLLIVYTPSILGDTLEDLAATVGDSLFDGLSERSYVAMAEQNRQTLDLKQQLVPVSGYSTRQYTNLCLNVLYYEDEVSEDKKGVLIKEKDANGRKVISRKEINGETYVRVKSTAMTGENNMVCYDEIGHDIMLPNYDKYNKEQDSVPLEKYTPRNHSCIGISFAGAITEHLTQAGLGFKHGGDLVSLEMETVNAPCMCMCNGYDDKYVYLETMEPCKKFGVGAGEELRYRRSACCIMNSKINPEGGDILDKDEIIMKKSVAVKPDDTLSKIFTITKTDVAGEFGKYLPETESWSVCSGKIKYSDNTVKIGTVEYEFNEDEIYFYPENVMVYEAQQISSGVPDMNKLKKNCKDKGILYSIFYYYIKSIDKFKDFNSEPIEVLFKGIVDENFNVQYSIRNRDALVDRLYYGGATKEISKMIDNAVKKAQPRKNRQLAETLEGKFRAKPNELTRKLTDTSEPTRRKISLAKDFTGGYDWKGIFNMMYNESGNEEYVTWSWDMVRSNLRTFKGFKNKVPQFTPSIVELQRLYSEGKLEDKSQIQRRTSEMNRLTNKDLMNELKKWLSKGVYGLPLSAYIDYNTRGITLVITHVNATDDEQEAVDEINNQINELKQQQLETEDEDKFNEIDEQINELKRERQKINNVTVPHISMGDSVLTGIIFGLR